MTKAKVSINETISTNPPIPSKFKVYVFDNDTTPRNLVKEILLGIFHHTDESAESCIEEIEREGMAAVGNYTFEVAEQKILECVLLSNNSGFQLDVTMDND